MGSPLKTLCHGVPARVQRVKDPVLLMLWRRSQLRLGFDPWPGNFHTLWLQPKKKTKTKTKLKSHGVMERAQFYRLINMDFIQSPPCTGRLALHDLVNLSEPYFRIFSMGIAIHAKVLALIRGSVNAGFLPSQIASYRRNRRG